LIVYDLIFFAGVLKLMLDEPLCLMLVVNATYCVLIVFMHVIQKIVFGKLRPIERQHIKVRFRNVWRLLYSNRHLPSQFNLCLCVAVCHYWPRMTLAQGYRIQVDIRLLADTYGPMESWRLSLWVSKIKKKLYVVVSHVAVYNNLF